MDLMRQGAEFLASRRKDSLSREVVYRRGAQELPVLSMRGRSQFEVPASDGTFARIETRDEIIAVDQIAADFGDPQRGDLIIDGAHKLHVAPPAQGIPEWSWTSPFRTMYRIHTHPVPLNES